MNGERDRFLSKILVDLDGPRLADEAPCWLWIGWRAGGNNKPGDPGSYGCFDVYRPGRQKVYAHRYAYELWHGLIPAGMTIDHLCRVRLCVNPAHLEAVTQRVNSLRGYSVPALNARKTRCKRGHEFTEENTYLYHGQRNCRACCRIRDRKRRPAKREAVGA